MPNHLSTSSSTAPRLLRRRATKIICPLCGLIACLPPLAGVGATIAWDGDTSTDFTDGNNWTGGNPPTNNITTDFASFTVASPTFQPSLAGAYSVTGVSMTGGYTLSGAGTLTVGASGIVTTNTNTISVSTIKLGANATLNLAGGTTTISSAINNNGFGLTLTRGGTSGSGNLDLSNSVISGTGNVTFNGGLGGYLNTISLNGANSFTGAVSLTQATISFTILANGNTNSSFGAGTADVTLGGNSSTFGMNNTGAGGSTDRLFKASTTGGNTINNNGSGTLSFNNTGTYGTISLTLGGSYTGGTNTFAEAITGAANVSKAGASTWLLSANNSYAGTTTIASSGGKLIIGNANSLGFGGLQTSGAGTTTVASGGMLDLNGVTGIINEPIILNGTGISSAGALVNNGATAVRIGSGVANLAVAPTGSGSGYTSVPTVIINGTGTGATATASLGLTQASINSATGGTGWVTGDTVNVTGGGGSGAIGTVTASGGLITSITITTPGTGYTAAPTGMSKLSSTAGAGTLALSGNATNFTIAGLTLTNAGTGYTGTPTITFNGSAATVTPTLSSVTLAANSSIGGTGDTAIDAVVAESGGSHTLTKVGAGTLTLTAANTYTGITTISAGTLVGSNTQAFGDPTTNAATQITLAGSATVLPVLSLLNNGAGNNGTVTYGGPTASSTGYNVTATTVGGAAFNVGNNGSNTGNTIQLGTLNSNQTLTFTNNNGYNLALGAVTSTSAPTFTNNMVNGTLTLASFTSSAASTQTIVFNGTSASATTVVSGVISASNGANALKLTQSGLGTLNLQGNNTYTGPTLVSSGTLQASASGGQALGFTSGVTVNAGGTLLLGASDQIKDTATMTLAGGTFNTAGFSETVGTLTLSSNSTIDFGTTASASSILHFAASNGIAWTGTLSIYNWAGANSDTDRLFFGTDSTALTSTQLGKISFYGDTGSTFLGNAAFTTAGELEMVPVPEPTTTSLILGMIGLVGWRERRRLARTRK